MMEIKNALAALAALSQETRLEVFRLLVKAGPEGMAAGRIAEELNIPAATLSFHLNHLRHAGLLRQERQSRSLIYSVEFGTIQDLLGFLMEDCCQGRVCAADAKAEFSCCTDNAKAGGHGR
jgi:DNA-binding transcriptional ArsR family regulator